jgi:hypothetical protein
MFGNANAFLASEKEFLQEIEMQTRKLGNSDLHITPVGYGAWAIGGAGWQFAWDRRTIMTPSPLFTARSN